MEEPQLIIEASSDICENGFEEEDESRVQVYADSCTVCDRTCFIGAEGREGYPSRSREVRELFYSVFDIEVGPEFFGKVRNELPLCGSCILALGELKTLTTEAKRLQKSVFRLKESLSAAIVGIVGAGGGISLSSSICEPENKSIMMQLLQESEVETLRQIIFEKWYCTGTSSLSAGGKEKAGMRHLKGNNASSIRMRQAAKSASHSWNGTGGAVKSEKNPDTAVISIAESELEPERTNEVASPSRLRRRLEDFVSIEQVDSQKDVHLALNDQKQTIKVEPVSSSASSTTSSGHMKKMPQLISFEDKVRNNSRNNLVQETGLRGMNHFLLDEESTPEDIEKGDCQATKDFDVNSSLSITMVEGEVENEDDSSLKWLDTSGDGAAINNNTESNLTTADIKSIKTRDGLFLCMFCNKTFIHKYPYRDHLKIHTGEGPKCSVCFKIFPKAHNLMLHMRTHTGERPFKCNVCGKGFADKSNLKVHNRVHTGERPYKCTECNLAFVNSSRLAVHRRTHSGEKYFRCNHCNKRYNTMHQLQCHKATHYGNKSYSCDQCGRKYVSSHGLKVHVTHCHGESQQPSLADPSAAHGEANAT